jgi:adenylate kinase
MEHSSKKIIELTNISKSYDGEKVLDNIHLKIYDTLKVVERLKARALSENRLDDMSDEVIHRRLHTYHEETFKTLSHYPSELVLEVDASRRAIDVLCDIANRLSAIKRP